MFASHPLEIDDRRVCSADKCCALSHTFTCKDEVIESCIYYACKSSEDLVFFFFSKINKVKEDIYVFEAFTVRDF